MLAVMCEAYDVVEEPVADTRIVMHMAPRGCQHQTSRVASFKKLGEGATKLYLELLKTFECDYDESGSIGKRYRRQDVVGTPFLYHLRLWIAKRISVTKSGIVIPWNRKRVKIESLISFIKSYL